MRWLLATTCRVPRGHRRRFLVALALTDSSAHDQVGRLL